MSAPMKTPAPTNQLTLPGIELQFYGKCVDPAGARGILGCHYHELAPLHEEGRIIWAINIASARAKRRELRFPAVCVYNYQAWSQGRIRAVPDYSPEQMAIYLFGPKNGLIKMGNFYDALCCKPCHGYALVADGSLKLAKGSKRRRGPGGSACIRWEDAVNFITARRDTL